MNSIKEIIGHKRMQSFISSGPAQMMKGLYRELIRWGSLQIILSMNIWP